MRCNIIMLHLHSLATVNKGNIGWYCVWREISSIDMKTGYLLTLLYNDSCLTFIHVKSITSPGMKIGFISFFTLAVLGDGISLRFNFLRVSAFSIVATPSEMSSVSTSSILRLRLWPKAGMIPSLDSSLVVEEVSSRGAMLFAWRIATRLDVSWARNEVEKGTLHIGLYLKMKVTGRISFVGTKR